MAAVPVEDVVGTSVLPDALVASGFPDDFRLLADAAARAAFFKAGPFFKAMAATVAVAAAAAALLRLFVSIISLNSTNSSLPSCAEKSLTYEPNCALLAKDLLKEGSNLSLKRRLSNCKCLL